MLRSAGVLPKVLTVKTLENKALRGIYRKGLTLSLYLVIDSFRYGRRYFADEVIQDIMPLPEELVSEFN